MSITKEETYKKYEYLDKNKDRYFDRISPSICKNVDEEGYFQDQNYKMKNDFINKYIDKRIEFLEENKLATISNKEKTKKILKNNLKFKRLSKIIKENASKKYATNIINNKEYFNSFLKGEETIKIIQGNLGDCYLISFLNGMIKFRKEEFINLLGGCLFELGYIEFNFFFEVNKNMTKKTVFVDDYILVDENDNNSPIFCSVYNNNPDSNIIYDIFQLIEKALIKVEKKDYFFLEGNMDNIDYIKYLTGYKALEIQPIELSDTTSKQLLWNIIDKNIENMNVLTAAINLKILYNFNFYNNYNKYEKEKLHMLTIDDLKETKIILKDPNRTVTEKDNNKDYTNVQIFLDKITIDINKFIKSCILIRICPFDEIKYTEEEKKLFCKFIKEGNYYSYELQEIKEKSNNYDLFDFYQIDSFSKYIFFTKFGYGIQSLIELFVLFGTRREQFYYLINNYYLRYFPYSLYLLEYRKYQGEEDKKKKEYEEKAKKRKEEEEERKRKEEESNNTYTNYYYYNSYEEERRKKKKRKRKK